MSTSGELCTSSGATARVRHCGSLVVAKGRSGCRCEDFIMQSHIAVFSFTPIPNGNASELATTSGGKGLLKVKGGMLSLCMFTGVVHVVFTKCGSLRGKVFLSLADGGPKNHKSINSINPHHLSETLQVYI